MRFNAVLEGLDVSETGAATFVFRSERGALFEMTTSSEVLEQASALLQSAFVAKTQRETGGATVERGSHWASTPLARIGPPAVATLPTRREIALVHAYGGSYQTAYAFSVEETERLVADLRQAVDEVRGGVIRF